MTTGVMSSEQQLEKQIEKQMGCMAGFLQIFDRHQILTGKRLYTTKRLPPSTPVSDATTPESEKSVSSPAVSRELVKPQLAAKPMTTPSTPERPKQSLPVVELRSPAPPETPPKSPLPLPIFELKEGTKTSWKFCKEAPRLSLDSRATTDAKGGLHPREIRTNASILSANRVDNNGEASDSDDKQRRSPSVIARLMGLEPLAPSTPEPVKNAQLRRSASESRVSRDLFNNRFMDASACYQQNQPNQSHYIPPKNNAGADNHQFNKSTRPMDPIDCSLMRNLKSEQSKTSSRVLGTGHNAHHTSSWRSPQHKKSFFDSGDVFPEPKQSVSVCGEIEKRLKMRGIDEASKDLDTLKHILEALQLKGLLHTKRPSELQQQLTSHRNFVYDHDSPIVVMKPPSRSSNASPINRRTGNESPPSRSKYGVRRNVNFTGEPVSPRRDRPAVDRNVRSPTRSSRNTNSCSPTRTENGNVRRSNSLVKPKPLYVETQRRVNESSENRRVSPVHSPKIGSTVRRTGSSDQNRSPRNKRTSPTAEIYVKEKITTVVNEDESSSISESTVSTSSHTDTERSKVEEYKEGRSLLERCNKLGHTIAEMNATTDLQPSPVSVLDPSFYKDDSSSPSPVLKRSIDFKDQLGELDEETWSPAVSPIKLKTEDTSDDCDFAYVSDILKASHYLPEDTDIFSLLEKQQYLNGKDTSQVSKVERKLIFDTITEILDRNRQLPPWRAFSWTNSMIAKSSQQKIWSEFQRIRERDSNADDLFEIICSVLKKDLAEDEITGWGDCPVEMSEAVLDIERLVFKDLIGETIRDLAESACSSTVLMALPRRKLVF